MSYLPGSYKVRSGPGVSAQQEFFLFYYLKEQSEATSTIRQS